MTLEKGDRFQYKSVVDRYHFRPDYAPEIYAKLRSFITPESLVLDIGCGPGKLAYPVAAAAKRVDAVDLSDEMINAARAIAAENSRINWISGDIHKIELDVGYDLMMAGASIHWMNLDRLFPVLSPLLAANGRIVFIDGDGAFNPPWGLEQLELLKVLQLEINDERPAWVDWVQYPDKEKTRMVTHPLFVREGVIVPVHRIVKSVDDYIEINFSRQSCALDCMKAGVADRFRMDLRDLLTPYADNQMLTYDVHTICEWGRLLCPGDV